MSKYQYVQIKHVLLSTNKYNNIFGVIQKYHEQGIFLYDETHDSIKVNLTSTCDAILPYIKPGNIIRLHRLMNCGNYQYRVIKSSDILLFSSFKDKDAECHKVRFDAKDPTIEAEDFIRVSKLEQWLAGKILKASLQEILMAGWIDMVCRVVDIKDVASHRVILVIADGTKPALKFNWFAPGYEQSDDFSMEKLVCVTAWDRHAAKARRLEKGSIIAFFNLQIAEAKIQPGYYELHLRGGSHYGKCIRNVHPNSYLGIGFNERLKTLNPTARPATIIEPVNDSFEIPSFGSSILDDSCVLTSTKDDGSPLPPSSTPLHVPVKKMKISSPIVFPTIVDFEPPKGFCGIREYLSHGTEEICCIKAKVKKYQPTSRKITDFIKLICPRCNYQESPSIETIAAIKESRTAITSLPCRDCQDKNTTSKLNATFWIHLHLQDAENYELAVTLTKIDVQKLLGIRVVTVLNSIEETNKFFDFLDFIRPSTHSDDPDQSTGVKAKASESGPFLKWAVVKLSGGSRVDWEYRVLTVFRFDDT